MRCKLCLKVVGHPSKSSRELQICGDCNKSNPFNYVSYPEIPTIRQVNVNGKRHYETPTGVYISITTLLHSLPLPPGLVEWKKKVGDDVANYMMRAGGARGTMLHRAVESYLSNKPMPNIKQEYGVTAAGLFELMIPLLNHIDNIRATEQAIYSTALQIAGTTDCVAEFDGLLSIIDFKTKRYMVNEESISDWLIQTTFYAIAWEELTGQKIEQIVIIVASEDGLVNVFKSKPADHFGKLKAVIDQYNKGVSE